MPSSAQRYLSAQQRKYKPRSAILLGMDHAQRLAHSLEFALPPNLRDLLGKGDVAVGEIGRNLPDVRVISVDTSGGLAIQTTSGMHEFTLHVASILSSNLPFKKKVKLIRRSYRYWKRRWRLPLLNLPGRLRSKRLLSNKTEEDFAEQLSIHALLFMVAHEFGHVVDTLKLEPPLSHNFEESADLHGIRIFLKAVVTRQNLRLGYAGAVFAVRLLAGLERYGFVFGEQYPPASKRLASIQAEVDKSFRSQQCVHEFGTVAVAYQDIFDAVDNDIRRDTPPIHSDTDRVIVRLLAELIEVAKGNVDVNTFAKNIVTLSASTDAQVMKEASARVVCYYVPSNQGTSLLSDELRQKMYAALTHTVVMLPSHLGVLFPGLPLNSGPLEL